MITYDAYYIYKNKKLPITIKNDGKILYFFIGKTKFSGSEFSDFCIEKDLYESEKDNFSFHKASFLNTNTTEYSLCNCVFEISIPQTIIDTLSGKDIQSILEVKYILGNVKPNGGLDKEWMELSITINGNVFNGSADLFEIALDQISSDMGNKYKLKNCYGCLFSDYSIYGQSSFGTMQCFVHQKETYLNINDKIEYADIEGYKYVQETFYCNLFETRIKGTGYRG